MPGDPRCYAPGSHHPPPPQGLLKYTQKMRVLTGTRSALSVPLLRSHPTHQEMLDADTTGGLIDFSTHFSVIVVAHTGCCLDAVVAAAC